MLILTKRAKVFMSSVGNKHLKLTVNVGGPTEVPDWIQDTLTFKVGVKDGSIIAVKPVVASKPVEPEPKPVDEEPEEDEGDNEPEEQQAKPAPKTKQKAAAGLIVPGKK
jgi:hypothetical protein